MILNEKILEENNEEGSEGGNENTSIPSKKNLDTSLHTTNN